MSTSRVEMQCSDLTCVFTAWQVNGVKWHQCVYCTKEFKKPSDVVRHVRIHTHEKPYKCMHCFRSFAVKSTLTAHAKTHTGIKDFKCPVCEKLFTTQGSLKVHLRLHTGQYFSVKWVERIIIKTFVMRLLQLKMNTSATYAKVK